MCPMKKGNVLHDPPGCGSYGSVSAKLESKSKSSVRRRSTRLRVEGERKPHMPAIFAPQFVQGAFEPGTSEREQSSFVGPCRKSHGRTQVDENAIKLVTNFPWDKPLHRIIEIQPRWTALSVREVLLE